MTKTKIFLDWADFQSSMNDLVLCVQHSQIPYDVIYGIPRGGLIPSVYLSHHLNIPLTLHLDYNIINEKVVLICDDIVDTGGTIEKFYRSFDIASVCYKPSSKFRPTYYGKEIQQDEWVVFPYETNTSSKYDGTVDYGALE